MITLTPGQKVVVTLSALDAQGMAAKPDSLPAWTTCSPSVLALAPSADGMSCEVKATGTLKPGLCVTATCSAGGKLLTSKIDVDVVAPVKPAATISLTAGTPA
jgi:hypothetical protein